MVKYWKECPVGDDMSQFSIDEMDLVWVDAARIQQVIKTYFHWKTLDAEIKLLSGTRGINFPSELSEYMACYALGLYVNKVKSSGDAVDRKDGKNLIIEIKGCSAEEDSAPNSFSPSEHFDDLVFCRLDKYNDLLRVYRLGINSKDLAKIKVNSKQTVGDQQAQGRRPRLSIMNQIIKPNNLEPDAILDIQNKKVIRKTK